MVKSISAISNIGKKSLLGAMLASSMFLGASKPIEKEQSQKEFPKTELISREAVEALKINTFQQRDTVPTVHNKKLDNLAKCFLDSSDDPKELDDLLNYIYNNYGTYMGSAIVQDLIDRNIFEAFLKGDIERLKKFPNGEKYYNRLHMDKVNIDENIKNNILKWVDEYQHLIFQKPFEQYVATHPNKPTVEETIALIDAIGDNNSHLFGTNVDNSDLFIKAHKKFKDEGYVQNYADLIAYKIHFKNRCLYPRVLNANGLKRITKNNQHFVHGNLENFLETTGDEDFKPYVP